MIIVLLTHLTSATQREAHMPGHRAFIKTQRDEGKLMMAGPLSDGEGGVLLFSTSKEEAQARMLNDPFIVHGVSSYECIAFDMKIAHPEIEKGLAV